MHTQINNLNLLITLQVGKLIIAIDNQRKEQKQLAVVFGNWGCTISTYEKYHFRTTNIHCPTARKWVKSSSNFSWVPKAVKF